LQNEAVSRALSVAAGAFGEGLLTSSRSGPC
jgi:hypothetical protein